MPSAVFRPIGPLAVSSPSLAIDPGGLSPSYVKALIMKYIATLSTLLISMTGLATAGDADTARSALRAQCESHTTGGDIRTIRCKLTASAKARLYRFKANFSGGHDDTIASLRARLDGAPLECDATSKTSLMGEDGDVSLACNFALAQRSDVEHVFDVTLSWGHAQYTDFEFDSD